MVWHFSGLLFLMALRSHWDYLAGVSWSVNCSAPKGGKATLRGARGFEVEVTGGGKGGDVFSKCQAECNLYQPE